MELFFPSTEVTSLGDEVPKFRFGEAVLYTGEATLAREESAGAGAGLPFLAPGGRGEDFAFAFRCARAARVKPIACLALRPLDKTGTGRARAAPSLSAPHGWPSLPSISPSNNGGASNGGASGI